ncbi:MAG: hypothetical protein RLZZ15_2139 [Verrucomicrobiota bacterium]|jgi:hypothetical protein
MNPPHRYHAFGLNILSEVEIPHWRAGTEPWDVVVQKGAVPRDLPGATPLWEGSFLGREGVCLLDFPQAGRVLIEEGRRVIFERAAEGNPLWLATLLATTGFAAVLYQRGGLCLHASAVKHAGRAYLIMGPSGAGKSTTASALLKRGGEFVSDDVTMVAASAGCGFTATASFPTVRLRFDSHAEIGFGPEATPAAALFEDKVQLRYHGRVVDDAVPIARICFLDQDDTITRPRAEPMLGQERVSILQRSLFRRSLARVVANPAKLAAATIALAREVDVIRVTRPTTGFALDELCALVLN